LKSIIRLGGFEVGKKKKKKKGVESKKSWREPQPNLQNDEGEKTSPCALKGVREWPEVGKFAIGLNSKKNNITKTEHGTTKLWKGGIRFGEEKRKFPEDRDPIRFFH